MLITLRMKNIEMKTALEPMLQEHAKCRLLCTENEEHSDVNCILQQHAGCRLLQSENEEHSEVNRFVAILQQHAECRLLHTEKEEHSDENWFVAYAATVCQMSSASRYQLLGQGHGHLCCRLL